MSKIALLALLHSAQVLCDGVSDFQSALIEYNIDTSVYTSEELAAYRANFESQMRDVEHNANDYKNIEDKIKQMITEDAVPLQTEYKVEQLREKLKRENAPWTAGKSTRWVTKDNEIVSMKTARYMQGTFIGDKMEQLDDVYDARNMTKKASDLPANFDGRKQWGAHCPSLLHVRNQAACGSCWAHGSTESYNDRLCIATGKQEILSTEHTTSCCGFFPCMSMGCNGGHPGLAWRWLVKGGVVTGGDYHDSSLSSGGCWPYEVDPSSHTEKPTPSCRTSCLNADYETKVRQFDDDRAFHKGGRAYMLHGIDAIRENLMKFGSVSSAFAVYSDFMQYTGGIYTGPAAGAQMMGGHAIKIVGWGHDDATNLDYWIVANSWGNEWGENGFFRIQWHSKTMMDWGCSAGEVNEGSFQNLNSLYV